MATLAQSGFETGDNSELGSSIGTFSVQSSVTRGSWSGYALQTNPTTTNAGAAAVASYDATGAPALFNSATVYARVWVRIGTLPASNDEELIVLQDQSGTSATSLRIRSDGKLSAYDPTPTLIATGTTVLSVNTWYRIELKFGSGGAGSVIEWKVNGVQDVSTTATVTLANPAYGSVSLGKANNRNGNTVNYYFDDVLVSGSAYPGDGMNLCLLPNANGAFQTWTIGAGSGSHYQIVNERPPDGDTSYLLSTKNVGDAETEALTDTGTAGITGTINNVKAIAIVKGVTPFSGSAKLRLRSATTNSDSSASSISFASYAARAALYDTDPATSAAWSLSGVDGIEVGAVEASASFNTRMTFAAAMVDFTPVTPVASFTGTPLTGTAPLSVVFTDASTNSPTSWLWEKNNGSGWVNFAGTPTAQNPTETFAAGTWSVRLTATNFAGSNTQTRTNYVVAAASGYVAFRGVARRYRPLSRHYGRRVR